MITYCFGLLLASFLHPTPSEPAADLDFWVGDWTMDLRQPDSKGVMGEWQKDACTNKIVREYDNKIIRENCAGSGLNGGSWSVYSPTKKIWQQTWVDDQGSYMLFEGGKVGSEFVLKQTNLPKGKHARMRFCNLKADGFDWLWESSADGKKWKLMLELKYHRKQ